MSIPIDQGTTPTLAGTVAGGDISGWVLRLVGLAPHTDFAKSSEDPAQLAILDLTAGTYEVYLTLEDTARVRNITVELRGQNLGVHYVLARDVLQINP